MLKKSLTLVADSRAGHSCRVVQLFGIVVFALSKLLDARQTHHVTAAPATVVRAESKAVPGGHTMPESVGQNPIHHRADGSHGVLGGHSLL
jgi:hypothetical protein